MRVLITGSSGFLAGGLRPALQRAGHEAVAALRTRATEPAGAFKWDPQAGTIDAVTGFDAVVHFAGLGIGDRRWTAGYKARVLDSRVRGTRLLAEAIAASGRPPAVLVSASAIGYYGDRGDELLTEDSAPGEGFFASVCRHWEEATAPAQDAGVRVVRLRTGLVLGRSGGVLRRILLPFRAGVGGRMGSGRQWWSWITLPDHVRAVMHLLTGDLSGPVNLTAPAPVTNSEFAHTLGRVLRRPAVVAVPAPALRLALGAEMASELLLASQKVEPRRLTTSGFLFVHRTLEAGLRAVLAT